MPGVDARPRHVARTTACEHHAARVVGIALLADDVAALPIPMRVAVAFVYELGQRVPRLAACITTCACGFASNGHSRCSTLFMAAACARRVAGKVAEGNREIVIPLASNQLVADRRFPLSKTVRSGARSTDCAAGDRRWRRRGGTFATSEPRQRWQPPIAARPNATSLTASEGTVRLPAWATLWSMDVADPAHGMAHNDRAPQREPPGAPGTSAA